MKTSIWHAAGFALLASLQAQPRAEEVDEIEKGRQIAASMSAEARRLCVFDAAGPKEPGVEVVRKLKVAKGSYGSVKQLLPEFAQQALNYRADAIVNYNSSQRFGFWPWRMVRPVVTGTAVRWRSAPTRSCVEMGGVLLETVLLTNRSPESHAQADRGAEPPAAASASAASE